MVCSADDLVVWRDFPKGLRVLLLDEDEPSAAETRLKLEAMEYIVSSFFNEKDALAAISKKGESFHVALVEVTTANSHGSFRFLEMTKDLPTVVISNIRCLSTMMNCIALGAAEFLQKPLSEEALRNIWQHVVHKAFSAGGNVLSKSLKPIKQTVVSMLQLQSETAELKIEVRYEAESAERDHEDYHDDTVASEIFSAPSTPHLKQGVRLLDAGDCEEQLKSSMDKENTENTTKDLVEPREYNCSESKSVENTCNNFATAVKKQAVSPCKAEEAAAEEEVDSADGSKTDEWSAVKESSLASSHMKIGNHLESRASDPNKKNSTLSINSHSHGNRRNRKMMKVDWTPELHRKFVQAVEQLGIDQAIPSKILELMKVDGLTRHNVASHLQKFRMHRRHIMPKDDDRRWQSQRDPMPTAYMRKPLVAFPPLRSNYWFPPSQVYPVWCHPSYFPSGIQMWSHAGFPPLHPPLESWLWNSYTGIYADAWGCPIIPPYSQCPISSQAVDEVIDEVVKEATSKPWLPLPLGLKPPSTDSILVELHRHDIRTIPPPHSAATPPRM